MKRSIYFTVVSLLSFAFAATAFSQSSVADAQVTEFDINGMKVLVKRRAGTPTVATGLFIKGGSRELSAQNAGIEDFMLNAAVEGSRQFPRAVLRRELASTGSSIGAGTSYDYSVLSLGSTLDNFERTWKIFVDVALNPALAASDVELTRGKLLTGLQSREDSPDASLQMLVDKIIVSGTTYGEGPDGTVETIRRFTAADLLAYHKKVMMTSRLLLVVVGDVDAETIKRLATASFGTVPRGDFKKPAPATFDFSKPTLDVTNKSLQTNYINGIFAAPALGHPDYFAMRVAVSILQDRLFQEIRVKRNLSYSPSASVGGSETNTGAIYVTSVNSNEAVRVALDEIKRLKTEPVSQNEISATAGMFLTNHFMGQETNAAQARDLAIYELVGGGWRNSFKFLEGVRAVRPDDVQAVANKYIRNLRFMVVGDRSKLDRNVFLQN